MRKHDWQPLEYRTFKHKNPKMEFFCPLCSTKRVFNSTPRLSFKNYCQMTLTTLLVGGAFFPIMGLRSFFVFFIFWAGFEAAVRMNFRKEVPCPHCGFDASWYKRDVTVARKKVKDFWDKGNSEEESDSSEEVSPEVMAQQNQENTEQQANY
ncbi:hypothetical protein A9Q84_07650 [Halobacteriovorax marinus]|uniref:Uncharacterized protein n=1 Tax=Halobacteriovorax marinus TaxID=97084 RepID=A0A1Y5F5R3_9BACT|nr:hypothetical protein A9Q84_07650 [Halobacteriovorax marinus]